MICRILQLTWRKSKVLSYSIANLDDVKELRSPLQVPFPPPPFFPFPLTLLLEEMQKTVMKQA